MSDLVEIKALLRNGGLRPRRWIRLQEAALYCGFVDPDKPDTRCRAFLDFCQAEGIKYKAGSASGKFSKLFDVLELDAAMRRNRREVAA